MMNTQNIKHNFERGVSLIENMVSLSILSIVIASASSSMFMAFHGNAAARTYSGVVADVHGMVDNLRRSNYTVLLDKFGTVYTSITNNQTAVENTTNKESHAAYTITYTAIKRSANSIPDAVRVRIAIAHSMGSLGSTNTAFETIIAGSS